MHPVFTPAPHVLNAWFVHDVTDELVSLPVVGYKAIDHHVSPVIVARGGKAHQLDHPDLADEADLHLIGVWPVGQEPAPREVESFRLHVRTMFGYTCDRVGCCTDGPRVGHTAAGYVTEKATA
jgi:hypothetical protein